MDEHELRAFLITLDDLLPGVQLDRHFTGEGELAAWKLRAFYHWPDEIARDVCQQCVGGAIAYSAKRNATADTGPCALTRLVLRYSTAEDAAAGSSRLASWLTVALTSSPTVRALRTAPWLALGDEQLWNLAATSVVTGTERDYERVEYGWRRGRDVAHVLGMGNEASEVAGPISQRLDVALDAA
jgi:hypothetical protein